MELNDRLFSDVVVSRLSSDVHNSTDFINYMRAIKTS